MCSVDVVVVVVGDDNDGNIDDEDSIVADGYADADGDGGGGDDDDEDDDDENNVNCEVFVFVVDAFENCFKFDVLHVQVKHRLERLHGPPGSTIVKAAENQHVDIIILGTRGHGSLKRTILGSESDYIVHHSAIPVMVCRKPAD